MSRPSPWTKLAEWGLLAVTAALPLFYVPVGLHPTIVPRQALVGVAGFALASAALLGAKTQGERVDLRLPRSQLWLWAYGALALLSASWALDRGGAMMRAVPLLGELLVSLAGCLVAARNPELAGRLVATACWSGALASLLAVLQSVAGVTWIYQAVPPASTFGNKNILAQCVGALLIPSIGLLSGVRGPGVVLRVIPFALLLSALLLTRTRGAWLAAITAGAAASLWLGTRRRDRKLLRTSLGHRDQLAALLAASLLALAVAVVPSSHARQTLLPGPDSMVEGGARTAGVRLALYRDTLRMIQEHPAGVGLGSWRAAFPAVKSADFPGTEFNLSTQPWEAHSDVLEIFAESGLLGGALFLMIFVALALSLARSAPRSSGPEHRLWALLLLGGIIETLAHALVDYPLRRPASAALVWLWVGVAGALGATGQKEGVRVPLTGALRGALSGFLFAGALLTGRFMVSAVKADQALRSARHLEAQQQFEPATRLLALTSAAFPHHFLIQRSAARDAYLAHRQGKLSAQEALSLAERALRDEPQQPRTLLLRGHLALELGDRATAERSWRELSRILPGNPEVEAALRSLDAPPPTAR